MKVRETVCQDCGQKLDNPNQYHPIECCISFKAGQDKGFEIGLEQGEAEGIRKAEVQRQRRLPSK